MMLSSTCSQVADGVRGAPEKYTREGDQQEEEGYQE